MPVSTQTQAILLLTAYFSKPRKDKLGKDKPGKESPKPLSIKEWGKFAAWLKDHETNPEQLLNGHLQTALQGWTDKYVTVDRIERLMNRGSALALAMEKWTRAGLWVLARSDKQYPARLKQLLKTDCPAILFGCGNAALLNNGGIAVVGARDAKETALEYSRQLGRKAANQACSIVSGGARGVDETAMLETLELEGNSIGVMADGLLRAATSKKYRNHLLNQNLVLISPYYPEAGFNAGNAMSRNKYIYCLSDVAVVVQSGITGGTWNGAIENLKKQWVPLWVREPSDKESGNALIIEQGGMPLQKDIVQMELSHLFSQKYKMSHDSTHQDIFKEPVVREEAEEFKNSDVKTEDKKAIKEPEAVEEMTLYEFFLQKLKPLLNAKTKNADELLELLSLNKTQLNAWLKQAVKDKKIRKLTRPVCYQWQEDDNQTGLFDKE